MEGPNMMRKYTNKPPQGGGRLIRMDANQATGQQQRSDKTIVK